MRGMVIMKKTFKLMGLMAMSMAALLTVTTPASAEEAEYRCGDINMDGKVDLADASVSLKLALGIVKDGDDGIVARNGMFYIESFTSDKVTLTDTVASLKLALGITVGINIVDQETGEVIGLDEFIPYNKDEKDEKKKYDELDEQYKLSEQINELYLHKQTIYWPGSIIGLSDDEYMSYNDEFNWYKARYEEDDMLDYFELTFNLLTLQECEDMVKAMCPELEWHFAYGTEDEIDKLWREKRTLAEKGKCFLPDIELGIINDCALLKDGSWSCDKYGNAYLLIWAE